MTARTDVRTVPTVTGARVRMPAPGGFVVEYGAGRVAHAYWQSDGLLSVGLLDDPGTGSTSFTRIAPSQVRMIGGNLHDVETMRARLESDRAHIPAQYRGWLDRRLVELDTLRPWVWFLWWGGSSYSPGYVDDDTEVIDTVSAVWDVCHARLNNRTGDYPCVTDDWSAHIWHTDPRGNPDPYPDRVADRDTSRMLCADCHLHEHGTDPNMGDGETSFHPGTCDRCRTSAVGVVFELDDDARAAWWVYG